MGNQVKQKIQFDTTEEIEVQEIAGFKRVTVEGCDRIMISDEAELYYEGFYEGFDVLIKNLIDNHRRKFKRYIEGAIDVDFRIDIDL